MRDMRKLLMYVSKQITVTNILWLVCIAIIVWMGISYLEVVTHNLNMNGYEYNSWNFFEVFEHFVESRRV